MLNWRKVMLFLLFAFGLSWLIWGVYWLLGGKLSDPWAIFPLALGMIQPALAAIIVQKGFYHAPLAELGLVWRWSRRWYLPFLLIVAMLLLTTLFSVLMPQTTLALRGEGVIALIEKQTAPIISADPTQAEAIQASLDQLTVQINRYGSLFSIGLALIYLPIILIAGYTINALFAFGEELGWRGLLDGELAPLGFWPRTLVTGVLWGLWHAPLIIQGYNYPHAPVLGVGMMVLFCVSLSPLHSWVRERSQTVFGPAVLHGTLNASAGLPALLFIGGSPFLTGVLGLAGMLAIAFVTGAVLYFWPPQQKEEFVRQGV